MELRPLGFGEIFDRAVTLYIRNFAPIAAIVAVTIVPLAVFQYLVDAAEMPELNRILAQIAHPIPTTDPFAQLAPLVSSPLTILATLLLLVSALVIWPFTLNAVALGVARLYRDRPIAFAACYRGALKPWARVLGVLAVEFAIFIAWYVTLVFTVVLVAVFALAFARFSTVAGIGIGVVGGAIATGELLLLAPLSIALTFAMYAIVIEERSIGEGLQSGFARVFTRSEFWRAVLFAIATGAIVIVASIIGSVVASPFLVAHAVAGDVVVGSLVRVAIVPFTVVTLAVYYFDVRIRHEGFDLEAALERLSSSPARS